MRKKIQSFCFLYSIHKAFRSRCARSNESIYFGLPILKTSPTYIHIHTPFKKEMDAWPEFQMNLSLLPPREPNWKHKVYAKSHITHTLLKMWSCQSGVCWASEVDWARPGSLYPEPLPVLLLTEGKTHNHFSMCRPETMALVPPPSSFEGFDVHYLLVLIPLWCLPFGWKNAWPPRCGQRSYIGPVETSK